MDFFKDLFHSKVDSASQESCFELCGSLEYEVHDRESCVYREGDVSNQKFYVILSGEVGVIMQKDYDRWLISRREQEEKFRQQREAEEVIIEQEDAEIISLELSKLLKLEEERKSLSNPKKKKHRYVKLKTNFNEDNLLSQNSFALSHFAPDRGSI